MEAVEAGGVLYEVHDRIAILTFNRPHTLNSQTGQFWQAWIDFVSKANADPGVGAIVVTGKGRAFSSGADMNESFLPRIRGEMSFDDEDNRLGGLGFPADWISMLRESKPIIAAVNGLAVGGGATAILPMDVIIAAEEASFMFPFARLGITPELGSSHYLAARVGFSRASEILLSARPVGAAEAFRIGLVNQVVPQAELLAMALDKAATFAAMPPGAMQRTKQLLSQNMFERDTASIWQRESDALRTGFQSAEHYEAVNAFLEKRKPDFSKLTGGNPEQD